MSRARLSLFFLPLSLAPLLLRTAGQEPARAAGGLVTLYAYDDLASSFDFRSGSAGGRVREGEVRLEQAQIAYHVLQPGRLSFGFTRDERVEVLDLGDVSIPPQARARDRAEEIPLAVVHTLCLNDNGFAVVAPGGDLDPYSRADRILGPPPPQGVRHLEPLLGHTYLVRVRRNDTSTDEFFKFQVVGLLPGHSLTLRWASVPRCG